MIPSLLITPELLVAPIVMFCCFGLVIWSFGIANKHSVASERVEKLERQLGVITSGSLGMGQRMIDLEKRIIELQKKQEQIDNNDFDISYTQAQQLIAQGVSSDTVAVNSGLSQSEVSLMELLHQHAQSATRQTSNVTSINQRI